MYINKVQLYGRLGKDPELKALPNGTKIVNFTMATTREWKNESGEKNEKTDWHNCVCFGKKAEVIAKWVKKGDKFFVEGRIETRTWEREGMKMYRTEIFVEDFSFGDNPKKEKTAISEENEEISYPEEGINPDDIPF